MSDLVNIEVVPDESGIQPDALLQILSEEDLKKVVTYLKDEYEAAKTEMDARNQKAIKWRKNMEAVASDAPKMHPMRNASNVVVPVTQMITQSLVAKEMATFFARDPLWTIEPVNMDEEELKKNKVVEKYLNLLAKSPFDLNMDEVLVDLFNEVTLIGGCFPETVYSVESWKVKNADGSGEQTVVWHDGPEVRVIPVERVNYKRGVGRISRLPWISIDTALTEVELKQKASQGIYDVDAVKRILGESRTTPNDLEEQRQQADAFDSGQTTGLYDITEVWFYYDVDGNGVPVDLFFTIHMGTGEVLKQQYNTLGTRFIVPAKYIARPGSLTGRGTGQVTESMQDEVTAHHNMRNDNMKIGNMRMIAIKRGSGLGGKNEIYPGKIWELDNPREDISPVQLGDIYPSSLPAENMAMQYAQRASALSDAQMGFADQTMKSRDSVRGQAMRIEQGDSILAGVMSGLKNTISQIGMHVWMQCIANKERVIAREENAQRLDQEELGILREMLEMPLSEVPMRMKFMVRTTDADRTYEQQRMNLLSLTQVFAQFAQQTIPLAMQVYSPQGQQLAQQAPEAWGYMARVLTGSGKLTEEIFKFFGLYNSKDYVPDSKKLDDLLDMLVKQTAQSFAGAPNMSVPQSMSQPQGLPPGQSEQQQMMAMAQQQQQQGGMPQ